MINYNISVAQISLSLLHLQIAWSVPQNCVFLLEVGEVIVISLLLICFQLNLFQVKVY